jgi:hypothetical protein
MEQEFAKNAQLDALIAIWEFTSAVYVHQDT